MKVKEAEDGRWVYAESPNSTDNKLPTAINRYQKNYGYLAIVIFQFLFSSQSKGRLKPVFSVFRRPLFKFYFSFSLYHAINSFGLAKPCNGSLRLPSACITKIPGGPKSPYSFIKA